MGIEMDTEDREFIEKSRELGLHLMSHAEQGGYSMSHVGGACAFIYGWLLNQQMLEFKEAFEKVFHKLGDGMVLKP